MANTLKAHPCPRCHKKHRRHSRYCLKCIRYQVKYMASYRKRQKKQNGKKVKRPTTKATLPEVPLLKRPAPNGGYIYSYPVPSYCSPLPALIKGCFTTAWYGR